MHESLNKMAMMEKNNGVLIRENEESDDFENIEIGQLTIEQFKKILLDGFRQVFETVCADLLESPQNVCQEQRDEKKLLQQPRNTEEENNFCCDVCEGKTLQAPPTQITERKRTDGIEKSLRYTLEPEVVEREIRERSYKDHTKKRREGQKGEEGVWQRKKIRCKRKMKMDLMKLRWQTGEIKVQEYKEMRHLIVIVEKKLLLKAKKNKK
ncbi:UNVERIFIED_CONTAM: hypothetical protein K2H54_061724 [Gekko kuhli]